MMRILFIARYRNVTMDRKIYYLAQAQGVTVRQVRPADWRDDLLSVTQVSASSQLDQVAVPMLGQPDDPHRALYRTISFGLRRFRPNIIHAEEEPDSLAALQIALARRLFAPRAKLILNTWQNVDRPRHPAVRWVTAQTLGAADGVLCANRQAQSILLQHGYPGYTEVLPAVGVDTQTFRPCPARPAAERFVVGYAGRLVSEKGLGTLLAALAQLGPTFELRILGGGPQQAELEAQVHTLGLGGQVHFTPAGSPAQVAQHLCQLDVLVLPSITTRVWKEQFGRVLVEAMACRVAVVGSDSGAIPEVIGDAGLTFAEGDAAALAECLLRLNQVPKLRQELAERGCQRAQQLYTQAVIAEKTIAVYRQLSAAA